MTQAAQRQGLLVTPSPTAPQTGYTQDRKKNTNTLSHTDSLSLLAAKAKPEKVPP